jgi:hypothetical protein
VSRSVSYPRELLTTTYSTGELPRGKKKRKLYKKKTSRGTSAEGLDIKDMVAFIC